MSAKKVLDGFQIRFDGPPGPLGPRFIEVEDLAGKSFRLGEWSEHERGEYLLVVPPVESKWVYIPWANTDLTEGRGRRVPLCVCVSRITAERKGSGKCVQGADAAITEHVAYKIGNRWYAPAVLELPSMDDLKTEASREAREAVLAKARAAGLSDEEIQALGGCFMTHQEGGE